MLRIKHINMAKMTVLYLIQCEYTNVSGRNNDFVGFSELKPSRDGKVRCAKPKDGGGYLRTI